MRLAPRHAGTALLLLLLLLVLQLQQELLLLQLGLNYNPLQRRVLQVTNQWWSKVWHAQSSVGGKLDGRRSGRRRGVYGSHDISGCLPQQ